MYDAWLQAPQSLPQRPTGHDFDGQNEYPSISRPAVRLATAAVPTAEAETLRSSKSRCWSDMHSISIADTTNKRWGPYMQHHHFYLDTLPCHSHLMHDLA